VPPHETVSLKTANFKIDFQVGDDGRLYQRAIGAPTKTNGCSGGTRVTPRPATLYLGAALEVTHADGNTSTVEISGSDANESAGGHEFADQTGDRRTHLRLRFVSASIATGTCWNNGRRYGIETRAGAWAHGFDLAAGWRRRSVSDAFFVTLRLR